MSNDRYPEEPSNLRSRFVDGSSGILRSRQNLNDDSSEEAVSQFQTFSHCFQNSEICRLL